MGKSSTPAFSVDEPAMRDPQDIVDIDGLRRSVNEAESRPIQPARRFLSVWFRCCHTYGRMYRNAEQTAYEGRCPRCAAPVHAMIGEGGTSRRSFEAG